MPDSDEVTSIPAAAEAGIGRTPVALAQTVHELHESLLASRHRARQRLLTLQDIERRHHSTPLTELVALAVGGALLESHHGSEDVPQ